MLVLSCCGSFQWLIKVREYETLDWKISFAMTQKTDRVCCGIKLEYKLMLIVFVLFRNILQKLFFSCTQCSFTNADKSYLTYPYPTHGIHKPEDHWSCIAHLSAEDVLKSAVIEVKKFKNIEYGRFGPRSMNDLDLWFS